MKNYKILLIIFFLFISNKLFAQNINYANLDFLIKSSIAGKKITTHFENKNNDLINEIKTFEDQIKKKEKSLISQKNVLDPDDYENKINLLRNEINSFNKKNNEKINKINLEKESVLNSFLVEINKILQEYAENNKIDIIMSSNQILIGKSNLDKTEDILKILNNKIRNFEIK